MSQCLFRDVLDSTGAVLVRGGLGSLERPIAGVSTDTRTLRAGELFLALRGPNFEGNRFAPAAARAGAAGLLLQQGLSLDLEALPADLPVAVHPDPRRALADLAAWYRSMLTAPVIGITGSCGKTTTKNILRDLLARLYPVVASPNSFNNDVGVPHTLLLAEPTTRFLVVEMGTNHPGEIAGLCRIARPTAGIVTNVGASHLEGLGSVDGVAREKGDLVASLPKEGFCVLNADCRFTPALRARTGARVVTFGINGTAGARADLDASDLLFHSGGTTFRLDGHEITSPLLGTHNVQNLLAALAGCVGLSIPLADVLPGVSTLSGARGRMERFALGGLTVFDDSYNANPESMRAAVRVLAGLHGYRRRILVLGDMLELGELAAELHHQLGREAAQAGIDRIVLVGELSKATAAGALEGGLESEAVLHVDDASSAAAALEASVREGDVILVKGSRRMHLEEVVRVLREARGS
jgi:UDP-N-acetylmuramoyl-tripeptide--D-alanyl-D-alanine ligase